MPVFGLIGNPLGHTFSKKYFTEKFSREKLPDHRYENFQLDNIAELKDILTIPGLKGFNITIPFKQDVLSFLDEQDELVGQCKACNCVRIENARLYGYNTDVAGFMNSVKHLLKPTDTNALVLGSGGSSKAIGVGLHKLGILYKIVSRESKQGSLTYADLDETYVDAHTLIVNATPLGSGKNIELKPPFPYHYLRPHHYLFDVVYNPSKSLFLQEGEKVGCRIKNGEEWLVIQAEESWKIWNQ